MFKHDGKRLQNRKEVIDNLLPFYDHGIPEPCVFDIEKFRKLRRCHI